MRPHTFAVLADVHGNSWALDAVLRDLERRPVDQVLNLGDSVFGPLDPAGACARLMELERAGAVSIRGNNDRILLEPPGPDPTPTFRFVDERISPQARAWLAGLPVTTHAAGGELFLCHGTPAADDAYLLEDVTPAGVRVRNGDEIAAELAGIGAGVVLCAHSHVPRVALAGRTLVVNPGSVGLPAYVSRRHHLHAMEAGSPHARYARLTRTGDGDAPGWRVEHVAVAYDWDAAARAALRNGRRDWTAWLLTGRAAPGESHLP